MMKRRVVITGMGAVSPYGVGVAPLWQGLREGRSAIAPLRHPESARVRMKVAAQLPEGIDLAAMERDGGRGIELLPGVRVVRAGAVRLVALQEAGWRYLRA